MSSRHVLAIALTVLGVFYLANVLSAAPAMVQQAVQLLQGGMSLRDAGMMIPVFFSLVPPAILAALLIAGSNRLAGAILRDSGAERLVIPVRWFEPLLWIGLATVGLFVTLDALLTAARVFTGAAISAWSMGGVERFASSEAAYWYLAVRAAIGVYLLAGAPRLRPWILRRMTRANVFPMEALLPALGPEPTPSDKEPSDA